MQSRLAKAVETFGYRVLFGQQTRWIKASDFIVHQVKDGSFKLQYAPKGKVADLYLMAGPRGSILVRGDTQATSLREGRPDRQGYAELFTVQVQGRRIVTRQRHGTSGSPRPRDHLAGLREHHGVAGAVSSTGGAAGR